MKLGRFIAVQVPGEDATGKGKSTDRAWLYGDLSRAISLTWDAVALLSPTPSDAVASAASLGRDRWLSRDETSLEVPLGGLRLHSRRHSPITAPRHPDRQFWVGVRTEQHWLASSMQLNLVSNEMKPVL